MSRRVYATVAEIDELQRFRGENYGKKWTETDFSDLKLAFGLSLRLHAGTPISYVSHYMRRPVAGVIPKLINMGLIEYDRSTESYVVCDEQPSIAFHNKCEQMATTAYELNFNRKFHSIDEKQTMTKAPTAAPTIEIKAFIQGRDASELNDEAIFSLIQKLELQVEKWNAIKTKPKKLIARIEEIEKDIQRLVEFVDSREVDL